jgi:hypothetical protein
VAKKSVFTSEALAVLDKKAGILKTAKDTTNPFANWKGPIGKYYARLRLISGKASKKPGAIDLIFVHTCLARLPDSSSTTAVPDEQYAGETMRIWASTAASKKQTEEQAWERTMQTIQAYDIKTAKFGMRSGSYNHSEAVADMAAALDYLNEKCPAVLIEVTAGTTGTFLNVQGIVDEKVVARFGHVQTEITDDMVGEIPPDSDESDSGAGVDELPDEDAVRAAAEEYSTESLLEMLNQAAASGEIPLPENLDFTAIPRDIIIDIGVNAQLGKPLPDLSPYVKKVAPAASPAPAPSVPTASPVASDDDEEGPAAALPDDEDEEGPQDKALVALQLAVATEDRTALKKRLRNMGALRPEDKFTTDQTDEFLRQWCIDVFTGAKPRLVAVAPTEVPFTA